MAISRKSSLFIKHNISFKVYLFTKFCHFHEKNPLFLCFRFTSVGPRSLKSIQRLRKIYDTKSTNRHVWHRTRVHDQEGFEHRFNSLINIILHYSQVK